MRKVIFYTISFLLLASCVLFFNIPKIQASQPLNQGDIVINELMWMGSSVSSKDEWIELKNITDQEIDISDWQITKNTGVESLMITIPDGNVIEASGYFLISQKSPDQSVLDDSLKVDLTTSFSLSNSNLQVSLYDGQWDDGREIIDIAGDGGKPLCGKYNKNSSIYSSMERNEDPDDGMLNSSWHTAVGLTNFDENSVEKGTPNAKNSELIEYSDKIIISEILPNPSGEESEEEFIELYNKDIVEVDLEDWILEDSSGNDYAISKDDFLQGTMVAPGEYFVVYRRQSGIALNNSGEEKVFLYNPNDQEIDFVIYNNPSGKNSVPENWSYNIFGNDLKWSTTVTPGKENIVTEEQISEKPGATPIVIDIAGVRNLPKGSQVQVEGIVTVTPGVLGSQIFYIQDSKSGIQIYCYKSDFPNLRVGDKIKVIGEISENQGEKRIKIKNSGDIQIIGNINPPSSINIKTGSVGEKYEGKLVTVSGKVTKSSGNIFYINDGSKDVKIYIRSSTGIKKPKLRKGDWVYITGIVSQTKSGYRILPRYQSDIKVIGKSSISSSIDSEKDKGGIKGVSKVYAHGPSDYHFSQPNGPPIGEVQVIRDNLRFFGWIIVIFGLGGFFGMKIMIIRRENVKDYF